ncbi:unnamed protein product [Arctia plantaginis]|uniref:Uncharacterized protein n=1 Tax=Arctia plantaginis TaxID=874455 RepID=A0A8S0YYX7_ARCPL|nr:unnamed protein product [Arctia plantaginis]
MIQGIKSYSEERACRREKPAPGLFTSIKLPEAEPPNGVAPLLDFPRGRMQPISFLGEGPHGSVSTLKHKLLKPTDTNKEYEEAPRSNYY